MAAAFEVDEGNTVGLGQNARSGLCTSIDALRSEAVVKPKIGHDLVRRNDF